MACFVFRAFVEEAILVIATISIVPGKIGLEARAHTVAVCYLRSHEAEDSFLGRVA